MSKGKAYRFRVQGSEFRVQGFRVQGSRFIRLRRFKK